LLLRLTDGGEHRSELALIDDRTEIVAVIRPDLERLGRGDELVAKRVIHLSEHDDPAARCAALPSIGEGREAYPFHRLVEIGIVAHDERVLSAELERDLLQGFAAD